MFLPKTNGKTGSEDMVRILTMPSPIYSPSRMPRGQFNLRHLNNEISHHEKFWNSSVNGTSVNGGVGYHFNDDDGEGEEYWRNRAHQAEHTAAAVCVSISVRSVCHFVRSRLHE